jgi:hypothetical protein
MVRKYLKTWGRSPRFPNRGGCYPGICGTDGRPSVPKTSPKLPQPRRHLSGPVCRRDVVLSLRYKCQAHRGVPASKGEPFLIRFGLERRSRVSVRFSPYRQMS